MIRSSTSLIIRETQTKTIMIRMVIMKKIYKQKVLEWEWRKENPFILLVGVYVGTATLENSMEVPLKKTENRATVWSSNPTLGHLSRENHNSKRHMYPNIYSALFTIVRTRKQPNCPSTDEWIKKMWGTHPQIHVKGAQLCLTLCDPTDCSTPGFPVHHQLVEFTQTHGHRVGNAIQPTHPLSSPSPPAFSLSQHQGLFQGVGSSHQLHYFYILVLLYIFLI